MGFEEFINESEANTPEEIVGVTVYYLMVYGGEETIQSSIAHDILDLYSFNISESAIALKLNKLKEEEYLKYLHRTNAPSGFVLTREGMERFEELTPIVETTEEGFEIADNDGTPQKQAEEKQWDVFISHASEDKEEFVDPLANTLEERGLDVWYDDFQISIGDSIPEEIDKGLSESEYGVVVLSHQFFQKDWTKKELNSLISMDTAQEDNLILPVWYNITAKEVSDYSPLLASPKAITTNGTDIKQVASKITNEIDIEKEPNGDNFDSRTVDYIAELIAKTWTGDDLSRFFERQGFEIDWDAATEGKIREYIGTAPVEASERGIDLDNERKKAVQDVIEEVNQSEDKSIENIIEQAANPKSHLGKTERHSQIVSDLNEALRHDQLKVSSEGEITSLDSSN